MAAKKAKKRKSSKKPSAAQLAARKKFAAAAKARSVAAKKKRAAASAKKPRVATKRRRNKTVIVKPKRVLVINGKKKRATKKRATKRTANKRSSPRKVTPKVKAMAEMFSGRRVNRVDALNCSDGTPKNLAKLGKLVLIKTKGGIIKPGNGTTYLCADGKGRLHLATTAAKLYEGSAHNFGEVFQVEYETKKPHLGYKNPTIFFHKMGEEGGKRPVLIADGKGGLKFRGGSYKIKREGIVN